MAAACQEEAVEAPTLDGRGPGCGLAHACTQRPRRRLADGPVRDKIKRPWAALLLILALQAKFGVPLLNTRVFLSACNLCLRNNRRTTVGCHR